MTDDYPQLVQQITEQVIAALRQRGIIPASPTGMGGGAGSGIGSGLSGSASGRPIGHGPLSHAEISHAEVHPPIGVCTGDYSQFPELAGRLTAQPQSFIESPSAARDASGTPADLADPAALVDLPIALGGIVTARQLQDALHQSADDVVYLANDARLTPLAADFAREHPHKIRHGGPAVAASPASVPSPGTKARPLPWAWWMDGRCREVEQIVAARRGILRTLGVNRSPQATLEVVKRVAELVRGKQIAGAMLFVSSAAQAMCMANRCPALRAVQGSCEQAVAQGQATIAPNILVIEYPWTQPARMAAMVDRMTRQTPAPVPHVERQLSDLQRG